MMTPIDPAPAVTRSDGDEVEAFLAKRPPAVTGR